MKLLPIAAVAVVAAAFSAPAALAQTSDTSNTAATADTTTKADTVTPAPKPRHVRHHRRYTSGSGLHSGSRVTPLPGKDELNSKGYLVDH
jgi:hypothetical protein